jgi:NMD protein affecting ribosome stability and mRNA decay
MQVKNSDKRNVNNPQYFQGILQLRNPTQEIIDFIADEIEKRNGRVWIAKRKELKNEKGVDLYLSSNQFLKEIGKKLKENFPGELLETARLFSRDSFTSRDVL